MILRRIKAHIAKEDWFAVFIDFVIVVFGVFMGIQLGNWNEDRKNQDLAAGYIERLQTEIGLESQLWDKATDYFSTAQMYGLEALAGFERPVEELDEQFLVALYQASQVWYVAANRATFDELQSTGRIVNIHDDSLRTALANHYLRVAQTRFTLNQTSQYRRKARLHIHGDVQAQIRSNCGDSWVTEDNNFYFVKLPDVCAIDVPVELLRTEIAKLHANTEVQQELRFHLSVLGAQLGVIQFTKETADATVEKLEAVK